MARHTLEHVFFALALGFVGGACGSADDGAGEEAGDPDAGGPAACEAGTQDEDGDGVCHPDCASTECIHGTCAIDGASGVAGCACDPGHEGDACDELTRPSAAGTALWLDAADPSSIATHDGEDTVATWMDLSPEGYEGVSASAGTAPTLVTDGVDGLPVVRFDDTHLALADFTGFQSAGYTVFLVLRAGAGNGTVMYGDDGSDTIEVTGGDHALRFYHEPDGGSAYVESTEEMYGGEAWSHDELHLVTMRLRDEDITLWIDGNAMSGEDTAGAGAFAQVMDLTLGGRTGGGNGFTGDIAELIVVSDALDHDGRRPFEDYLATKWFGAPFERTPTAFGEAMIWLDASDGDNLLVAGGEVHAWGNMGVDRGAFGNGAFADARPQLVEEGLNGLPVLRFDGSDALVQNDLDIRNGAAAGQYTLLAVVVPSSAGDGQRFLRADNASNDARAIDMSFDPSDGDRMDYYHRWPHPDSALEGTNLVSLDLGTPMIVKIERSELGSYHVVAGDASTTNDLDSAASNWTAGDDLHWCLGGEQLDSPNGGFQGDVAELILLGNTLDDADESALVGALAAKWGID